VLVTGKPFQSNLMFVRKGGAYPSGAPKKILFRVGSYHYQQGTNIRLGWKPFLGTNTLAYYEHS
jgi:hypothetical protein